MSHTPRSPACPATPARDRSASFSSPRLWISQSSRNLIGAAQKRWPERFRTLASVVDFALQSTLNTLCVIVMRRGLLQSFACILHELGLPDRVFRAPAPQYDAAFAKAFLSEAKPLIEQLRAAD